MGVGVEARASADPLPSAAAAVQGARQTVPGIGEGGGGGASWPPGSKGTVCQWAHAVSYILFQQKDNVSLRPGELA